MVESVVGGAARPTPAGGALAAVALLRPQQWTKNVLVAAAPLAAGRLLEPQVARGVLIAFASFCLAASAAYVLNDLADVEEDRRHPTKRRRPIASGAVRPTTAAVLGVVLGVAAMLLSWLATPSLTLLVAVYLAVMAAYSLGLKHVAVLDLAVVSGGFLMRAIAGGVATATPLSRWFLIVTAFGSLFVVAGKRYSELVQHPDGETRRSLQQYTPGYLRFVWGIAAAVTVTGYCLWAFDVGAPGGAVEWGPLSVIPFVLGLLRFAVDVDQGRAGEPETIFLSDRVLQAIGLAWLVIFALGAFGG